MCQHTCSLQGLDLYGIMPPSLFTSTLQKKLACRVNYLTDLYVRSIVRTKSAPISLYSIDLLLSPIRYYPLSLI